jgi:hypothetical protein
MHHSKNGRSRLADRPADYKRLGIAPVEIAQFEDGQRIGTKSGRYEWWYFDAHLDNGATVVVVFYNKPNVSPNGPLAPRISIGITLPDGRTFEKFLDTSPELFDASKSTCDDQGRDEPLRRRSQSLPHHGNHRGDIGRDRIDGRGPRLASQVRSSLFCVRGGDKAEHTIHRGALQAIASELIGQNTQKRSGESEFHDGIRHWIRVRDERIQKDREAAKAARPAPPKREPRKPTKPVRL